MVAPVRGGEIVFLPALYPLDGLAQLFGDYGGDHLFGVQIQLASEPAAHVGRDDPYLVLGMPGDEREQQPNEMRDLGGGVHGELVGAGVEVRHDAARLHGVGDEALVDDALGDADFGARRRRVEIAAADFPLEGDVVGRVFVNLRRAVLDAGFHVDDGVEDVVIHGDQRRRVRRRLRAGGDDRRHRVADAADFVDRQRRMRHFLRVRHDPPADEAAEPLRQIRAGEHRQDAVGRRRGGGVHADDVRVRVGAANERHVRHADHADVVHVGSSAGNQSWVFAAFYALADCRLRSQV